MTANKSVADTISGLLFLRRNCGNAEICGLLGFVINLCFSISQLDPAVFQKVEVCPGKVDPQNVIASLEFLSADTKRQGLDDMSMVIDAAAKLVFAHYYCHMRGEAVREEPVG